MFPKSLLSALLCAVFCHSYAQATPLNVPERVPFHTQSEAAKLNVRENFLQLESLLNDALKEKRFSPQLFELSERLLAEDYPLQEEIQWLLLRIKLAQNSPNVGELVTNIQQFAEKYPYTAKRQNVTQLPFSRYAALQQWSQLVQYSTQNAPQGLDNQCYLFQAKQQLSIADHNPDAAALLLQEYDLFRQQSFTQSYWQNKSTFPEACAALEQDWAASGFADNEKRLQQAVALFEQNAKKALQALVENTQDDDLKSRFTAFYQLAENATTLPQFVQNNDADEWNKRVVLHIFPQFIRTRPEQIGQRELAQYLEWAEKFQLTEAEKRDWTMVFLNRAFDNEDRAFKTWRDAQITQLRADNLTERRIRSAIREKTPLMPWLSLLSDSGKAKQEWRYWLAKADPTQRDTLLRQLRQERGFYPMLAAYQLGEAYRFQVPEVTSLSEVQQAQFQPSLDRIHELRTLKRFDAAKSQWIGLLQALTFEEKMALTAYAYAQNWFDLSVEGTIQAKAWDYLPLRLPNAYSDWFDWHLQGKSVSKSFAMAIARQESAWNAQARSHANAIGLMQMLPSTAKQTAEANVLPFQSERDLYNPFKNIMLGTTHLNELNTKYPNNRILIAAAYNAGASRVERWLARADKRLDMDEFIASIPFLETRGYVQNVLAYDFFYQQLWGNQPKVPFSVEELRKY